MSPLRAAESGEDMTELSYPTYFAGVLSADGYCSHLNGIYDPDDAWRTYLIKGGAGMGKSTLMKGVTAALSERGQRAVLITCPSDPDSLDGVIFPDIKACIMDATAPHIVNPVYPELCEVIVNVGDHCDRDGLTSSAAELIGINRRMQACYQRASRYISAISSLKNDTYRIAYDCSDTKRASNFAVQLASRLMPKRSGRGSEKTLFLSAVTPKGYLYHADTVGMVCDRVVAVEDEYGAVSQAIMSSLRMAAVELGYDVIACASPFAPEEKTEQLLIPELKLGFVTQNRWLKTPVTDRIIHARRFEDVAALHQKRQRLSFNRRAVNELIEGTVQTLQQAKSIHDELEKLYVGCMDFGAVNLRKEAVINDLLKRADKM